MRAGCLAFAREEVWHIGDSLTHDVARAQAAGVFSVWLNRAGREPAAGRPLPDRAVLSLRELI
jgi:FMN phosphatase YigB (HAD superfamily)